MRTLPCVDKTVLLRENKYYFVHELLFIGKFLEESESYWNI